MSNDLTRVKTGKVRLSYVNVFVAKAREAGQEEKFSTVILLPKTDIESKAKIDAAIAAARGKGVNEIWKMNPPIINIPVYDGDGVKPSDGMPFGDECKGHWVFTASAKKDYPPQIVDARVQPILNQSELYSGVYARVSINFYPYSYAGKKGIGVGLGNIQKVADGPSLAGGRSASEDFDEYTENASQSAVNPVTGQPMASGAINPITGKPM